MAAATQANPQEAAPPQAPPTENKPKPSPLYQWVTTCPTDWLTLRVRGEDLVGITHSVVGYHVNDKFEFEKLPDGELNVVSSFRILTGRDFIGVAPLRRTGLYRYKANWNKFRNKQDGDDNVPVQVVQEHGEQIITFIPFVSQYPLVFPGVEVIGAEVQGTGKRPLIPVTFIITVRVRMLKPRIAVMQNVDWLGNVVTVEIRQFLKTWAAGRTYDELFRGSDTQVRKDIAREFREFFLDTRINPKQILRSPARCRILEQGGVDLISIDVVDIIPDKEFEKSLLKQAQASIDAETTVITADGARRAKEKEGEGEASYIDKVSEAEERRIKRTSIQVAGGPGANATEAEIWRYIRYSNLTTFSGKGGASLGIIVGADGKPVT